VPVVLFVLDDDGTFTLSEGQGLANLGFESEEVIGRSFFRPARGLPAARADVRDALDGVAVNTRRRLGDRIFETSLRPIADDGTVDRVIGVANDITERVQYQEALNALHEATSHLLTVDSKGRRASTSSTSRPTCSTSKPSSTVSTRKRTNCYRRRTRQPSSRRSVRHTCSSPTPAIRGRRSSPANRRSTTTEARIVRDEAPDVRSGLSVPLGEHGVLVALSTEPDAYTDETVELAELFATTAEAALDRIGRSRRLRERERELKKQNRHLERLNAANEVRQEVEQLLLMADSRSEIERGVPECLAELESCSLAWFGEPDPSGNSLSSRDTTPGSKRGYLDAVTITTVNESAAEPAGRAARTRSPIHVENVAASVHDGEWRGEALSRNFQSAYAIPLVYDGFCYGVLSIYGEQRGAFDETLRSTLAELGETIAYAIDAVKRKNALFGDGHTEVELEVAADATTLCRLAEFLGEPVTYEGRVRRREPTAPSSCSRPSRSRLTTRSRLPNTLLSRGSARSLRSPITRTRRCSSSGSPIPFWVRSPIPTAHDCVSSWPTRRAAARSSTCRTPSKFATCCPVSAEAGPRCRWWPDARGRPTIDRRSARQRGALLETFTDRQREVVQAAYHGGFFEWPRRANGEEIAGSLDISSPAFHKHVRSAERKLFAALFEGRPLRRLID